VYRGPPADNSLLLFCGTSRRLSLFGAMQMAQYAFTVSFRVRLIVRNGVRDRVRVRVRLFSPLRHLHCAEYRKSFEAEPATVKQIRIQPVSVRQITHCYLQPVK